MKTARTLFIRTEYIKLQDFLKLGSLTATGGEAKIRIQAGEIQVNGEVCVQRGRKIHPGDWVTVDGKKYVVGRADG